MLNRVTVQGRLVKDAELRSTADGTLVTSFVIACERNIINRKLNEKETDFFDVVAWKEKAEFITTYFEKGDTMIVDGHLQARTFEKDGDKKRVVEILVDNVYFGKKKTKIEDGPFQ